MTGYAEAVGAVDGAAWRWEARSVNGRGLDVRVKLPSGWDALEQPARRAVAARLTRGSVTLTLRADRAEAADNGGDAAALSAAAGALARAAAAARAAGLAVAPTAPERLLALAAAATPRAEAGPTTAALEAAAAGLEAALDKLAAARRAEGATLAAAMERLLDEAAAAAAKARAAHDAQTAAAPERLRARVAALLEAGAEVEPDRLAAELSLLAVKADVAEELDRLAAHDARARALLAGAAPCGRELDFLAQEFGREANTLCAKSASTALTQAGLALKLAVDRIREQAQNIE